MSQDRRTTGGGARHQKEWGCTWTTPSPLICLWKTSNLIRVHGVLQPSRNRSVLTQSFRVHSRLPTDLYLASSLPCRVPKAIRVGSVPPETSSLSRPPLLSSLRSSGSGLSPPTSGHWTSGPEGTSSFLGRSGSRRVHRQ